MDKVVSKEDKLPRVLWLGGVNHPTTSSKYVLRLVEGESAVVCERIASLSAMNEPAWTSIGSFFGEHTAEVIGLALKSWLDEQRSL